MVWHGYLCVTIDFSFRTLAEGHMGRYWWGG